MEATQTRLFLFCGVPPINSKSAFFSLESYFSGIAAVDPRNMGIVDLPVIEFDASNLSIYTSCSYCEILESLLDDFLGDLSVRVSI